MRDIILEVRAEAEAELIMAKAKLAVADSILAKYEEKTSAEAEEMAEVETEEITEEVTVAEDFTTI